jgi:hypothetical protein
VLWFYRRDESLGGKIGRVLGRVAGKPPAGYNELQAALAAATGGTTANASPRQTVSRT